MVDNVFDDEGRCSIPTQISETCCGFLSSIACPESQNAEHTTKAILKAAEEKDLDLKGCCVGAGADGASVNFGCNSGVMKRLEDTGLPWLMKIHCVAHRLELALKDAFKDSYFQKTVIRPTFFLK